MKKVVVFTEGLGELIFLRHILFQIIGYEHLSCECFELNSDNLRAVPYKVCPPNALIHYQIISVGTDERVLSEINERYQEFVNRGFEIIGLRDMYSEQYKKKSNKIAQEINLFFLETVTNSINNLSDASKIHFFFAIMELEAWLLALYKNFEKIAPLLTVEYIRNQFGFDLQVIDPEKYFFHPAVQFKQVLRAAKIDYDKHWHQMESIVSGILLDDIIKLVDNKHCHSFALLISEIQREYDESQVLSS